MVKSKFFWVIALFLPLTILVISCNSGGTTKNTTKIEYTTINYPDSAPDSSTFVTGIRQVNNSTDVYITGSYAIESESYNGTLYKGSIFGGGDYYIFNYPSATGSTIVKTTPYGPDNGNTSTNVQIVGSYNTLESGDRSFGFFYDGPITATNTGWHSINYPESQLPDDSNVLNTIPHNIMNNIIVGNYDTLSTHANAFIYNTNTETYSTLVKLGSLYTTAYGIWWNGGTSYTIAGGYSNESTTEASVGYLVDYDSSTRILSNWTDYSHNNQSQALTHFEGITSDGAGGYNLAAGWKKDNILGASFVNIKRTSSGALSPTATWIDIAYPNALTTTANTVYQNYCLGVYNNELNPPPGVGYNSYLATIPVSWYIFR